MAISERFRKIFMGNRKLDMEKIQRTRERFESFRKKGRTAITKVQKFATEMEEKEKKRKKKNLMAEIFDI